MDSDVCSIKEHECDPPEVLRLSTLCSFTIFLHRKDEMNLQMGSVVL